MHLRKSSSVHFWPTWSIAMDSNDSQSARASIQFINFPSSSSFTLSPKVSSFQFSNYWRRRMYFYQVATRYLNPLPVHVWNHFCRHFISYDRPITPIDSITSCPALLWADLRMPANIMMGHRPSPPCNPCGKEWQDNKQKKHLQANHLGLSNRAIKPITDTASLSATFYGLTHSGQ